MDKLSKQELLKVVEKSGRGAGYRYDKVAMVRAYLKEGATIRSVSAEFGCAEQTLVRALREARAGRL